MKIRVIEGATLDEATKHLANSIDNSEGEHVVIVPDRFSLLMEKQLLSTLKTKAMFNVSVVGLSSLVVKLLGEVGLNNIEMVSMSDSLLLTSQAIKNVSQNFQVFRKSNINFCHQVQNAISQFKSSGVNPDELTRLTGVKQKKYHDLGLIYEEYEHLLAGRLDANGLLEYFNFVMRKTHILSNKKFYFAEFDAFTAQTYEVIKTLTSFASEINIALPRSICQGNAYIYEDDIYQKLKALARELGVIIEVVSPKSTLNPCQEKIAKNLYSFDLQEGKEEGFLSLVASSSAKEEASALAKIIKYKVYKGARYKDFAIACGNLDDYEQYFSRVFNSLDIPFYIDKSETADRTILANFIFKILEVFVKDYSKESLQALVSNLIFNCETSETICKKVQSLNVFGKARYKKYLVEAEPRLADVLSVVDKSDTYQKISNSLKQVIEDYKTNYTHLLDVLKENENVREYNINIQAEEIIIDALDKIAEYNQDEKCSKSEYLKQLKLLLTFQEVSTVPTYVDGVMIGDATTSFFGEVKNLIIAGGECLPQIKGDSSLLSDDDIASLSVVKKIEPTIRMINRRNRFKLFNLLCLASNSLIVSFLELNSEGKKVEMPTYVDSLSCIFGQKVWHSSTLYEFSEIDNNIDIQKLLISSGSLDLALEECGNVKHKFTSSLMEILKCDYSRFDINRTILSAEPHSLFFPKDYTKVTQLETYFNCPFKHFLRYGLRVNEFEKYEFDERDIGNICHKLAEMFVKKYRDKLGDLSNLDIRKFLSQALPVAIKEENLSEKLDATIDKNSLLDYIDRLAFLMLSRIAMEQKASSFRPVYTEKNLDELYLEYDGNKIIRLLGKIDRIDEAGDYFRIMDYKTGKVAPILKDLYYGDKLQLFLYENAAAKMLNKVQAGTLYFDCRYDYDKVDSSDAILKGVIVNDEDVISLFDRNIQNGKSDVIAVSTKAGGGYKGSALAKYPLENFEEYAKRVSSRALGEMESGYIAPKPDASACDKCGFKSICLFDKERGYRKKDKINQEDIMEVLKK